jgi:hypothetical protein
MLADVAIVNPRLMAAKLISSQGRKSPFHLQSISRKPYQSAKLAAQSIVN